MIVADRPASDTGPDGRGAAAGLVLVSLRHVARALPTDRHHEGVRHSRRLVHARGDGTTGVQAPHRLLRPAGGACLHRAHGVEPLDEPAPPSREARAEPLLAAAEAPRDTVRDRVRGVDGDRAVAVERAGIPTEVRSAHSARLPAVRRGGQLLHPVHRRLHGSRTRNLGRVPALAEDDRCHARGCRPRVRARVGGAQRTAWRTSACTASTRSDCSRRSP